MSQNIKSTNSGYKKSHLEGYLGKEVRLSSDVTSSQIKFLQGKILTIIDAAMVGEQKKAVKDLINAAFSNQLSYIQQLHFPDTEMMTEEKAENILDDFQEIVKSVDDITSSGLRLEDRFGSGRGNRATKG